MSTIAKADLIDVHSGRDHSRRNAGICAVLVGALVVVVHGNTNLPFMDDFSYAKTALDFARTGHFVYNGWATAMLGWLVPWGALFIKAFGFSFFVVQLSMIPLDMACVYVLHQILRRFGITPFNAVIGTLTMALSPLFLPLAASFMTDVPGLLVILLCIYMCQRAVGASTDRAALLWLCSATLVNVAGGTVRQIAWAGALLMVPSTAWLLRDRRGMKLAGVGLFLFTFLSVLACVHWFSVQPYSVSIPIYAGPVHPRMVVHLLAQLLKAFFCMLLIVLPVLAAWLPVVRRLSPRAQLALSLALLSAGALAIILERRDKLGDWLIPWLSPLTDAQGISLPGVFGLSTRAVGFLLALAVTLLILACLLIVLRQLVAARQLTTAATIHAWRQAVWILGPYTLGYTALLMPLGTYTYLQDRYVLGLVPPAMVFLLKLYQERVSAKPPAVATIVLAFFALYSIGGARTFFAESSALSTILDQMRSSGIPRLSIQTDLGAGLANDGWAQIEHGDHLNDPRIRVPVGAYRPIAPLQLPENCQYWFTPFTPSIVARYYVVLSPLPCFEPPTRPAVHFHAWLPPFDRTLYVQERRSPLGK